MTKLEKNLELRAGILGVLAGMRSMAGLTTITQRAAHHPEGFKNTPFHALINPTVEKLSLAASAGEFVMDKMPFVPARTALAPILVRALLGGGAGAAAYAEARKPLTTGALIGAISAIASSFAFYWLRRGIGKVLPIPDLPIALAEDGGVLALARVVERTYE